MKVRILGRGQGRADDNEEVFANRIKVYQGETLPILEYFKEKGNLFNVSANGTKTECFDEIRNVIKELGL